MFRRPEGRTNCQGHLLRFQFCQESLYPTSHNGPHVLLCHPHDGQLRADRTLEMSLSCAFPHPLTMRKDAVAMQEPPVWPIILQDPTKQVLFQLRLQQRGPPMQKQPQLVSELQVNTMLLLGSELPQPNSVRRLHGRRCLDLCYSPSCFPTPCCVIILNYTSTLFL